VINTVVTACGKALVPYSTDFRSSINWGSSFDDFQPNLGAVPAYPVEKPRANKGIRWTTRRAERFHVYSAEIKLIFAPVWPSYRSAWTYFYSVAHADCSWALECQCLCTRGSRGITPLNPKLGTSLTKKVRFTPRPFYPRETAPPLPTVAIQ